MSVAVAPEILARWEVWRSFESCIRSYAAAEGLGDEEAPRVNALGDHIDVTWHGVYLGFTMQPGDGTTAWLLEWAGGNSMWGGFQVLPEGSFLMRENKKDIDHAAIDFLRMLKKRVAAGQGAAGMAPEIAADGQKGLS